MKSPRRWDHAENHRFTFDYAQPREYRFCQDSVITPMVIAEWLKERAVAPDFRVLDLCAGCGVLGFELFHYERRLQKIDFIEVQGEVFRDSFHENVRRANYMGEFRWLELNFSALARTHELRERYDLVVCNPPYFFPGDGKLSASPAQNRCRFFLDAGFDELIEAILAVLKPGGSAFVLMKSGASHGRDIIAKAVALLASAAHAEVIADIRGTALVQITKHASPYSCQR